MYGRLRRALAVCATTALLLGPIGAAGAADAGPAPLDKQIADTLKEVHNRGADMFNNGDAVGCYRVFQGLLWTVRPLLGNHPDLQKEIDAGMAGAERLPTLNRRAVALHDLIESVRRKLGPAKKPEEPRPPKPEKKPDEKKPEKAAGTLWDRLGGEANVRKIVDDLVATAAADPKVNFDRNGKYKLTDAQLVELKGKLVAFISHAAGGPIKYTAKDMKAAHKGMGITDAEFDAAKGHLRQALQKHGATPADIQDLLGAVEEMRKNFVEKK